LFSCISYCHLILSIFDISFSRIYSFRNWFLFQLFLSLPRPQLFCGILKWQNYEIQSSSHFGWNTNLTVKFADKHWPKGLLVSDQQYFFPSKLISFNSQKVAFGFESSKCCLNNLWVVFEFW
jgi:hypothetical protein